MASTWAWMSALTCDALEDDAAGELAEEIWMLDEDDAGTVECDDEWLFDELIRCEELEELDDKLGKSSLEKLLLASWLLLDSLIASGSKSVTCSTRSNMPPEALSTMLPWTSTFLPM